MARGSGSWLEAHGSRLMARGSWLEAHGSRLMARGSWLEADVSREPWEAGATFTGATQDSRFKHGKRTAFLVLNS
jgi:hypothetical protein